MTTRAKILVFVLTIVPLGLVCGIEVVARRGGPAPPSCDLDRRLFETAGASSSEITDRRIPGATLFRYRRNRDLTYASVIGCRPATGELLQPDEVFELLPHGGGSAEELAALHAWCFSEGGLAELEIVRTEERFVALHGRREFFLPPTTRLGVVSFWRADTDTTRQPAPRLYLYVIDSLTGLGARTGAWDPKWLTDPALIASMLDEEHGRSEAFPFLALKPHREVAKALIGSLHEQVDPELRYLGLMGLRGEAGIEQLEPLALLAEHESTPLVRMGVVQTLATIPAAQARPLATAILQRESDARARRVMQAALKE